MSAKAKKPAKNEKPAKAAKAEKASPAKKGAKAAIEVEAKTVEMAPAEGAEEESDEDESASSGSGGGGGNAAALAAATGATEMSASFKNFRHHPDMENFYRFIYENDLRLEALQIIDEMMQQKTTRKALRAAKANAH
jgi:hypothetical protein